MKVIEVDKLKNHYAWWGNVENNDSYRENKTAFDTIIDLQPTYEIIKCKDCKYWLNGTCTRVETLKGQFGDVYRFDGRTWSAEDYCSRGEKNG